MAEKTTYVIALNDKLSPGLKKATAKALGLDKAMGGLNGKAKKGSKGMSMLGGSIKGLIGPLALAAAAMKAFQFASESVKVARDFESLENAISFASGGAEKGAENMDFLRQRSELLGTDLLASAEGFKTLSASMLGTKLEGQATNDVFDGIQVASSVMGLSAEQSKGAFLALGQMMGKGKVQAEELRGQLGERIPGAFNIAARAMGVTTQELDKMMEQGQLISDEFLPKFSDELKKTFGPGLEKSVNSAQANFNRFNNSMLELKLTLGRALMPAVNRAMDLFKKAFAFIKANAEIVAKAFKPLTDAWKEIGAAASDFFTELTGGASVMDSLQMAFSMLQKGLNFLKPAFEAAVTIFKSAFGFLLNIKKAIVSLLETFPILVTGAKAIALAFRDVFVNIAKSAADILGGVGDLIAGIFSADPKQIEKGLEGLKDAFVEKDIKVQPRLIGRNLNRELKPEKEPEVVLKLKGLAKESKAVGFDQVLKPGDRGLGGAAGLAGAATGKAGKKSSSSVDGIKSGRPTNINIDIGKLIETFNITATDLNDINNKTKDMVAQALLSAVNNVNNIAR